MDIKKKLLCLPVELYKREMLPKLYLALKAVEQGYQVLIGYHNDPAFEHAKDGFYFYKDHANWSVNRLKRQSRNNMLLGALDEEGLIYDENVYSSTRGSKELLDSMDAVFLWGNQQLKTVEKISDKKENKYVVGSPKFEYYEMLKSNKKKDIQARKVKILINTRFTYVNGLRFGDEISTLKGLGYIKTKEEEDNFKLFLNDDNKIFDEFDLLIRKLAKNDLFDVVIRPHPAENKFFYKKYEELYSNIKVDNDSVMVQQILDSDIVVHDGCTTAIEARALGVPVLGLRPDGLINPYNGYANKYSFNFKSAESLYEFVCNTEKLSAVFELMPKVASLAKDGIDNWGEPSVCTDKILSVISSLPIKKQNIFSFDVIFSKSKIKSDLKDVVYKLSTIKCFDKVLNMALGKDRIDRYKLNYSIENSVFGVDVSQKFYEDLEYVSEMLSFKTPKVIKIRPRVYLLYSNN